MNIVLGITGSVSAYKTPWLVRDLRRDGHDVRVVMTPSARAFVAPLALEATSSHHVIVDPFEPEIQEGGSWHVHLAQWADVMLIAPCSATTLSRVANGLCDNALMTVAFSLPKETPLVIAPAMDSDMWLHAATQRNVEQVKKDGVVVIDPEIGALASGLVGVGRLPELETIVSLLTQNVEQRTQNADISTFRNSAFRIVITAGPTVEPIDAVRSIINHSSGKMGFALAEAARDRGMLVTLISGPVNLSTPHGIERIDVRTAAEMSKAVKQHLDADVVVMAAAVADYTMADPVDNKLKKSTADGLELKLKRTEDILEFLGKNKTNRQVVVGFALEFENVVEYAKEKLTRKNADMIVANQAGVARSGFGSHDNTITIVESDSVASYPPLNKRACAEIIMDKIAEIVERKMGTL